VNETQQQVGYSALAEMKKYEETHPEATDDELYKIYQKAYYQKAHSGGSVDKFLLKREVLKPATFEEMYMYPQKVVDKTNSYSINPK
jgi:hypothetical protein